MNQPIRYSFGADEHLFAEVSEPMSLEAFFRGMSITHALEALKIEGILDICLANASFQIRFDPDLIAPDVLLNKVQEIEVQAGTTRKIQTRILQIPVLYNDPWTHETLMRFRERHQDPSSTDIEYAAKINGYADAQKFIEAHSGSPWFVSMVGFVAGLPFMYQMVEQQNQIQVPKYLLPRTDTPKLTLGHGGCFGCIYSVRGAGGYQMFGVTPVPIYDPEQNLSYLKESLVLFRPGDIVQFQPIEREEYDEIVKTVEANQYQIKTKNVTFDLDKYLDNPDFYKKNLQEALYANKSH